MADKFEWTNELIMEFVNFHENQKGLHWLSEDIEKFKKSKEKYIPKPDWEILSFNIHAFSPSLAIKDKHGWYDNGGTFAATLDGILKEQEYQIHSVKRSDGEIFTVGNKFLANAGCDLTIDSFKIINSELRVISNEYGYWLLSEIRHPPKPKVVLFTTEDGCEIFAHNAVWILSMQNWCTAKTFVPDNANPFKGQTGNEFKYFSTEEKAIEYKTLNKPIKVSYKELYNETIMADWVAIKNIFKSKIQL